MTIENNEIGYNGEHLSRVVVVNVEEELRDKDIYLEFQKPSGKKLVSSKLTLEDGKCEYYLGKDLLDEIGYLKIQVVAKGENFVKKSSRYGLYIADSINASEEVNEEFEDVLTEKEKKTILNYAEECGKIELPCNNRYCYCIASHVDIADEWEYQLEYYSRYANINKEVLEKFEELVKGIFETLCKTYEEAGYNYFYEIDIFADFDSLKATSEDDMIDEVKEEKIEK